MARVGTLKDFDSKIEGWTAYVERFECYCLANGIKAELKVATFLASMGPTTYAIARNLASPELPKDYAYGDLKTLLEQQVRPLA